MIEAIDKKYEGRPTLTVSETARFMGVGKSIIYQLIEFGELVAIREHGKILVEKRSVDLFRSSGKLT